MRVSEPAVAVSGESRDPGGGRVEDQAIRRAAAPNSALKSAKNSFGGQRGNCPIWGGLTQSCPP